MNVFFKYTFVFISCLSWAACTAPTLSKRFHIGFAQCCDDPWRDVMEQEMYRELAFHPEVQLSIEVANNNSAQQIKQIKALVESGIDLLIVSPNESQPLTPVIEAVYKSGIPVILIDRKTESEQFTAFIGADNIEIGKTAGKYIANHFNGKGNIIELQLGMTITPARERSQGFREALHKFPNMHIVAPLEVTDGMELLKAQYLKTLEQHPETDIVFAHTDFLAESAFNWTQEMGQTRDLFFVGIDGIPGVGKGIQAVEDGTLDASMLYPTGGAEGIRLALSILNNLPFDKKNLLETIVINEGNARILHLQMKKVESLQRNIDNQLKVVEDLHLIYRDQRVYIAILLLSLLLAIVLGGVLFKSLRAKEEVNRNLEIKTREALEHEQQIMQMSDELKRATQVKVDFFTNISHEFRTPLTLILGYVEGLLTSGIHQKEAKQDLGMVRKNALRLLRLVNQLMDFRKIESGKMAVRASNNDLVAFTKEIVEAYRKVAIKRNIQLVFFSVETTILVWFDVNMLDKVLFNLLSNAFKFTPDGGKIQVAVVIDPISDKAIVKVEDNGRGMSKEHVEKAFERFYQGTTYKAKGTGLGLSLSKELVNLHGGEIDLWSEGGKGARFEVSLPLGKAHFREDQLAHENTEGVSYDEAMLFFEDENQNLSINGTEPGSTGDQTLLLIEDNEDLRHFLKQQFGKNYTILEAPNGNAGLDQAMEEVPDLIIADISMPGRDGLTLTKILKSDLRTSHIPIILLTARNTMEQKIEGIQTGADAYVTKPFNLVFLSEIVRNLLKGRAQLREKFSGSLQQSKLPTSIGELDQQFLRKFSEYIDTNFADQNLTVERLSEVFGLSRVQLFRKTKALLGESPNDYIQQVRLKKASKLLVETQLSISEIAYQTGYSSPGYFSTAFKARFACSPSEWRETKTV
ncbi:MAG: substrate-binding domain-containing protein [Saprospiraceae bacterium]|nr:substrate-binding domain-containing protein [Saprospiraceae bacterium]